MEPTYPDGKPVDEPNADDLRDAERIATAKAEAGKARALLEAGDSLGAIATVLVGAAELAIGIAEDDLA